MAFGTNGYKREVDHGGDYCYVKMFHTQTGGDVKTDMSANL